MIAGPPPSPPEQGREFLHHLRLMPVPVESVRAEVLADLGEVRRQFQRPARAGDAGLGVDDRAAIEPARRRQGRQPQDRGGGIAARHGHQLRLPDLVAVQFGQPVDGVRQEVRRGVLAVPARVLPGVVQAEVGAAIDHGRARLDEGAQGLGGGGVRQRREHHVDIGVQRRLDRQVQRPEVREDVGQALAGLRSTGDPGDLDARVLAQQSRQFCSHVAGDVDDAGPDHRSLPIAAPCSLVAGRRSPRGSRHSGDDTGSVAEPGRLTIAILCRPLRRCPSPR